MSSTEESSRMEEVLDTLRVEIAALFDGAFPPSAIRTDVDVLANGHEVVEGFAFDSLDIVEVIAMVEELYDVSLRSALTDDEPMTLVAVADHLLKATG